MSKNKCIEVLGGWEAHRVETVQRFEAGHRGRRPQVWIELIPRQDAPLRCSGCGGVAAGVHETTERWVRDLPVFDADTWLLVHRRRVLCPRCGPKRFPR